MSFIVKTVELIETIVKCDSCGRSQTMQTRKKTPLEKMVRFAADEGYSPEEVRGTIKHCCYRCVTKR